MNILVLEDRGSVSFYLNEALEAENHSVRLAFNINDARSFWEERETWPIHCLIVDLNMPPEGLSQEQMGESHGGILTGWLWLVHYVFASSPAIRTRVVIYSEYLDQFKKLREPAEYADIRLVPKRGSSSSALEVLRHVRAIDSLHAGHRS